MADLDLGTARGKIEIDSSDAEYGIGKATKATDDFSKSQSAAADKMIKSGAIMVGGAAAIGAGFAVAINAAADFETRISGIAAVSGATEAELEQIRQKALQLGADTKFSAGEAAGAMEELIKAGLSTTDVMNGAADATVNLAAAGEIELTQAAEIAANAMNAFNLAAEDLPHVADLIAGAANASAIDVGEFAQAMQQSSAVANLAGLSFDDLSVAIAAMGNAGIKGSDAGTSLKTFLQNLQPATAKQTELFKELGIVTEDGTNKFYDANGSLKSLADVSQVLQDSLAGMTDQQKQATLETLFGSDAIRAAAVIADEGAAGMTELATAMGKVSAESVAETRMDNLSGSIEQLKGSVETLLIIVGRPLADALRVWVDRLTSLVNFVSGLDAETLSLVTTIGKMVAVVLGVVGAALILRGAIIKLRLAMIALNVIMRANPVGLILTLLVALAAALYTLYQNNEQFREAVQRLFSWLQRTAGPIIEQIVLGVQAMIAAFNGEGITSDGIVGFFERVGVGAREVFEWVKDIIAKVIELSQTFAKWFGDEVIPVIERVAEVLTWLATEVVERVIGGFNWLKEHVWPVLKETGLLFAAIGERIAQVVAIIIAVLTKLQPVFSFVFATAQRIIETFITITTAIWRRWADNIWAIIQFAFNTVKTIVEAALRVIQGIIQVVTGIISGDWSKAWDGIKNIFGGIWDVIKAIPRIVMDAIFLTIKTMLNLIATIIRNGWETVKLVFSTAWDAMRRIVGTQVSAVIDFVKGLPGRAVSALGSLLTLLVQKGKDLINGLWNGAKAVWDSIVSWIKERPGVFVSNLSGLGNILFDIGKAIINGLWRGMKDMWNNVTGWLGDIGGSIVDLKGPPEKDAKLLTNNGQLIMESLLAGMQKGWPDIERMLSQVAPTIQQNVEPTTGQFGAQSDGGDVIDLTLEFPNVGSAKDAEEIRAAVSDPNMFSELVAAIKGGKR